jgi:hypothetical protein
MLVGAGVPTPAPPSTSASTSASASAASVPSSASASASASAASAPAASGSLTAGGNVLRPKLLPITDERLVGIDNQAISHDPHTQRAVCAEYQAKVEALCAQISAHRAKAEVWQRVSEFVERVVAPDAVRGVLWKMEEHPELMRSGGAQRQAQDGECPNALL